MQLSSDTPLEVDQVREVSEVGLSVPVLVYLLVRYQVAMQKY